MDDLISRQGLCKYALNQKDKCVTPNDIMRLPSAQPEPHYDEWCTDCKEYDQERHCCPRWNRVIRQTLKDAQPEPCEDAVSRKDVEEMLQNGFPARGMWEIEGDVVKQTVCETLADALMDLEKLPSVTPKAEHNPDDERKIADLHKMVNYLLSQPEQRWIPCSERLPDEDGRYLVTCARWGAWAVDWNIWRNDPKPSWLWEQGVTAWMPLPEPYREEGDE